MPDYTELLKAVKRAAVEAVAAGNPSGVYFGKVISVNPLQIRVDQKMVLGQAQLALTRHVTDYEVPVDVEWETEKAEGGSGEGSFSSHTHKMAGAKKIMICNGLKAGDQVILMRQQGGQKYIVTDKVG